MYPKLPTVTKGQRRYEYLQIVESFRDSAGRSHQRVVLNLGAVTPATKESLLRLEWGGIRLLGEEAIGPRGLEATAARMYGAVLVGQRLWEQVGLGEKIGRRVGRRRNKDRIVHAAEAMVINRLVAPGSKLAVERWLKRVYLLQWEGKELSAQHFYMALDVLHQAA